MIRAKFKCVLVTPSGVRTAPMGGTYVDENEVVRLDAVYSSDPDNENKQWAKYTPSGQLSLTINNPAAQGKFVVGQEYFLDITPASA